MSKNRKPANLPKGFPEDLEPTKENIRNWEADRDAARESLRTPKRDGDDDQAA